MNRRDIINLLVEERRYESYLEIGLDNPSLNFIHINCKIKESVDPYDPEFGFCTLWNHSNVDDFMQHLTYRMTSDEFFKKYPEKNMI